MYPAIVYDLGRARLAEFYRQARRDALTRAARRARPGPSRRRALNGAQVVIDQVPSP